MRVWHRYSWVVNKQMTFDGRRHKMCATEDKIDGLLHDIN